MRPRRDRAQSAIAHKRDRILQRMLKVAADLSAPAQVDFLRTIGALGEQLRTVLLKTDGIIRIDRNHSVFWKDISGNRIGFVDGGLANLSMLGSAPIAARVGGYSVVPGRRGEDRETFVVLKHLIDELYSGRDGGVYDDAFPNVGALRDAARIAVEAAGAVQMLTKHDDLHALLLHGALVNPVSRYSDVMRDGQVHRFPDFPTTRCPRCCRPASFRGRVANAISSAFISANCNSCTMRDRRSAAWSSARAPRRRSVERFSTG